MIGRKIKKIKLNRYRRKCPKVDASIFRLGAESYSSLGRVGKKEENTRVHSIGCILKLVNCKMFPKKSLKLKGIHGSLPTA